METFIKTIIEWIVTKSTISKILFLIAAILVSIIFLFCSCSTFKNAQVGGYHKVDKVVKDSLYYHSNFSK